MDKELSKPLYSLTVGEFRTLIQDALKGAIPEQPQPRIVDQEEHFTIEQLKQFLNCSKVTLHNYKKKGLPYYRIGRKLLFKKTEVLEFMRKNVKRFFGIGKGKLCE